MIKVATSGEARPRRGRGTVTSLDPKNGFDSHGESRPAADRSDCGDHAWHERGSIEGIMPDGQGFTFGAEQNLLMRDQTTQPDAMDPDAVNLGTPSPGELLDCCVRWRGERSCGPRSRDSASRVRCGARWRVGFTRVMQLNDLGAFIEGRRLFSEAHHEHRSDGEVWCHQDTNAVMLGESLTELIQSVVCKASCADNSVDAVIDTP